MYPPVYSVCAASAGVTSLLGSPPRFYPFGDVPQDVQRPYAAWQIVGGVPENYLDKPPDLDSFVVQIDAYADAGDQARSVAAALRDALEPVSYIISWRGEGREPDTLLYRYSFDIEYLVKRS